MAINILHCGDIHIRTVTRYRETKHVFDNLFAKIRNLEDEGKWNRNVDRLYVGGDIVHSKLQLSPECVDLLSYFFLGLSEFGEVDIILGNHDCNLNNLDRLDAITPVIGALDNKKLHLYSKPELIDVPNTNLTYGIYSVLHDNKGPKFVKDEDRCYIAFFHGPINNSLTDINFKLTSNHSIIDFEQYDYGMFADIHKRQYLDKKHHFAYCGSLFQNNYGEELKKGCMLWSFDTSGPREDWSVTKKFLHVPNDYGFFTLDLSDKATLDDVPKIQNISKKPSIRVILGQYDYGITAIKELTNALKLAYDPQELKFLTSPTSSTVRGDETSFEDIDDIGDISVQERLLREYFEDQNIGKRDLKALLKINKEVNDLIDSDDHINHVEWRLDKLRFNNTFSYGEDNEIDFSALKGVSGIFAPNAAGKSSIFMTILYALYNTNPYVIRTEEVVNKLKNKAYAELEISVGDTQYKIQRTTTVPSMARKSGPKSHYEKYSVRTSLDFAYNKDDEWVSLNGKQRTETEDNIRNIFGTYDDFLITSMAPQGEIARFLEAKEGDRINYIMKFLGLNIFNDMYSHAKDQVSEIRGLLSAYKKQDYSKYMVKLSQKEVEQQNIINNESTIKKNATKKSEVLYKKIVKLASQVVEIDDSYDLATIEQAIDKLDTNIQTVRETTFKLTSLIDSFEDALEDSDTVQLDSELEDALEKIEKFNIKINKLNLKRYKLKHLNEEIDKDKELVQVLHDHEYDESCQYCISCNFVKDAIDVKVALKKKLADYGKLNDSITLDQNSLSLSATTEAQVTLLEDKKKKFSEYESRFERSMLKLESLEHQLNMLNSQKEEWETRRRLYFRQEEQIKRNKEVRNEIAQFELDKIEWQESEREADNKILAAQIEISKTQERLKELQKTFKNFRKLENKSRVYDYYLKAIHRTGIPYRIVQKNLSHINKEINKILSNVAEFKLSIEVGENTKSLPIFIYYNDDDKRRIETGSGMEKLLSAIAIRAALVKISSLPKCNIFAIDEGFGSLDPDNLNEMKGLFEYLKTLFDHILIITHIEAMQDVCDNIINVEKKNGFSNIIVH